MSWLQRGSSMRLGAAALRSDAGRCTLIVTFALIALVAGDCPRVANAEPSDAGRAVGSYDSEQRAEELRLRLLARLIASYGGQSEPLRLAQLEALVERVAQAGFEGATLAGAIVMSHGDDIRVWREAGREALPTLTLPPGASGVWDRRFRVGAAPDSPGPIEVRALGAQAFARLRQDFDTLRDLPAGAAATLPAFWHQEELIVVPRLAGLPGAPADWEAQRRLYSAEFLG